MSQLNANEIIVLMHCYVGHPIPRSEDGGVHQWALKALRHLEMLDMLHEGTRELTERGHVFVEHITNLNLPHTVWSMK